MFVVLWLYVSVGVCMDMFVFLSQCDCSQCLSVDGLLIIWITSEKQTYCNNLSWMSTPIYSASNSYCLLWLQCQSHTNVSESHHSVLCYYAFWIHCMYWRQRQMSKHGLWGMTHATVWLSSNGAATSVSREFETLSWGSAAGWSPDSTMSHLCIAPPLSCHKRPPK